MIAKTNTVYKTSFGQYVPLAYEDYKKLRVIMATFNVAWLKASRLDGWGRKAPHNRNNKKPELCPVFFKEKIRPSGWWCPHETLSAESVGFGSKVTNAWEKAQPKVNKEDVEEIDFGFDLDMVYNLVLPYYNRYCKYQK